MKAALVALLVLGGSAAAEGVDRSPRPVPNPAYLLAAPALVPDAATVSPAPVAEVISSLRPQPRPGGLEKKTAAVPDGKDEGLDLLGLRPEEPAAEPETKPKKKRKKDKAAASKKGSVCGVAAIKGEKIATIKSKVKGCGLKDGVRVTSVAGVRLSQAATIDCATAKALAVWVDQVVQPAYGGSVVELKVAAHYICRTRNNVKGAKVSEHGRGKAIDIAGFVLDSGKTVSVAGGFNKTMRRVYKGACGIFGTTLGPGSDGYHEDHMHFDTAGYRSGPYCR
ncbi:extensin family protein [Rhodobacter sp. Har01]|uniref:extensin-like domain-containing protein n=1 Tax=Rhodobacter sp. Har01 TaxID=2883999 RepID=UPI001D082EAC|nr:extensin family protein [Rhodobacter sp. Har01]MCB6179170.1 extensin family protein [Rhodobacter sp. Har01]